MSYQRKPVETIAISRRYSDNLDYLVTLVLYLGRCPDWLGRTPARLAPELSLSEAHVLAVFENFPAVFRRSDKVQQSGQYTYSLQARYAHLPLSQEGDGAEIELDDDIPQLSEEQLKLVMDAVLQQAEAERSDRRAFRSNLVSIVALIAAATSTVSVALINALAKTPAQPAICVMRYPQSQPQAATTDRSPSRAK